MGCYALGALVRFDVSEELRASINRVTRIGKLRTTLAANSSRRTVACHPEDGGTKFLRNSGFYQSHTT
jgi:hypothetical protein